MNIRRQLLAVILLLLLASPLANSDPFVCGNIDGDPGGVISISDIVYAISWLWSDGPSPPNPSFADWDNHQLLTIYDLYQLVRSDFPPTCPPFNPPLHVVAQPHAGLYLHTFQSWVPPYSQLSDGKYVIDLYATTDSIVQFTEQTIGLRVGGAIPQILGFDLNFACSIYPIGCSEAKKVDTARGVVSAGWWDVTGTSGMLEPGRQKVATITISVSPGQINWQPITVALDSTGPIQDGYFVHQNWSMPEGGYPVWQNSTASFPCVGMRGNINGDPTDQIDMSDLTYLVGYMFGSTGVEPPLNYEEVDLDASLSINVGDLTSLVGYMFKGGPAPEMCPN